MGTVKINGVPYEGRNISIKGNRVFIDGEPAVQEQTKILQIEVEGDLMTVLSEASVMCRDVKGDVHAGGSITCRSVGGNADAGGSISAQNVQGGVAAGGSVTIGGDLGNLRRAKKKKKKEA